MGAVHISRRGDPTTADLNVEIVERKGVGHPDSICDAIMEDVSRALPRAYRDVLEDGIGSPLFGRTYHRMELAPAGRAYLLAAGETDPRVGWGTSLR